MIQHCTNHLWHFESFNVVQIIQRCLEDVLCRLGMCRASRLDSARDDEQKIKLSTALVIMVLLT